jgi:triacylglycerol esterase/lipase EstA (alpha/beta hydrolase family)
LKSVTDVCAPSFYGTPERSTEFVKQVKLHVDILSTAAAREARLREEASDEMTDEVEEIEGSNLWDKAGR